MKRKDIFEYLYTQRYKKGIVPTLDRLLKVFDLKKLNLDESKIIHIAGSNGKGSTSSFLKSILESAGKKVALFTSPHIKNIEERFYITNHFIDREELIDVLFLIKEEIDQYQSKYPYHFITFFEYMTLAFFRWCSIEKPDYIILEVGMGGRFDATNIVDAKYGAITSISLDHTSYLGDTIEKIAFEKAGIVKNNQFLVVGNLKKEALEVIKEVVKNRKAKLIKINQNNTILDKFTKELIKLNPMLKAKYQINNLKIAIELAKEIFKNSNYNSIEKSILNGIKDTYWPARFEVISEDPIILRDVAHNIEGMKLLEESILNYYKDKNIITIFTVMKDKNYLEMLKIIDRISKIIIFCKPIERAENPLELQKLVKTKSIVIDDPQKAFTEAKNSIDNYKNSMILATGSIFLMEYIN